ncbi:helix-turn-helix domain-containing protein [Paenibacillus lentus]|uniref:AraC family transcriptional regulator n=1 Tax=Paenibacillus lentus TaxID=1338368 RepID=UPI00364DF109
MEQFIYRQSAGITALSASISDFQYKKHCHEEYALGVTLRGIQQYHLDGSLLSSHQSGVMLFNPEQNHDGRSRERSGIDYVMIYIHPKLFLEMLGKKEVVLFDAPIVYHAGLRQSILNLTKAIFSGKPEALCHELLLALADHFSEVDLSPAGYQEHSFVRKAKEVMHSNLGQVLKIEDISTLFGMSKYQFIRSFKANTGTSPYQYYLNCKVERAKRLIEENRDIYLAVTECGFVDLAHLNRHFKNVYGTTAFEYMSHLGI